MAKVDFKFWGVGEKDKISGWISCPDCITTSDQRISDELIAWCWKQFDEKHEDSITKGE